MKKLILFFLVSASAMVTVAQNWCPPGATWFYGARSAPFLGVRDVDGFIKFKYVSDTVINLTSCKKIVGTFTGTYNTISYSITIPNFRTYFTYEDNSVLYLYRGSSFDTVVNYKANIGDKWTRLDECLQTYKKVTVTDTGHCIINGINLRTIKTSAAVTHTNYLGQPYTSSAVANFTQMIYNSNMGIKMQMFPFYCDKDETGIINDTQYPVLTFRCYSDNSIGSYNPTNMDCTATEIEEIATGLPLIMVYPIPAKEKLFVAVGSNMQPAEAVMRDLFGREIFRTAIGSSNPIEVGFLSSGIYFLNIFVENKLMRTEKIVKE